MAQPTSSDVHVNRPLTNLSIAYIQNHDNFIADKVFPAIPVDKQTDIIRTYTKNDWFRDEAKPRASGTESAGSGYNITSTTTYACIPNAIHKDIDKYTRANADDGINLDSEATEFVTQRLLVRKERAWATNYFTTSIWGTDVTGGTDFTLWSTYATSTPIADVETGKAAVLASTGYLPNTLVLGYDVFKSLKNHPDFVDRFKYTSSDSVTADMMAGILDVERVLVAKSVYATNVEGATGAYSFVHGKNALLCYSAPRPSLLSVSAGYTFLWRGVSDGMGATIGIKRFPLSHLGVDRVEGEVAFDYKLIGSDLGYFFASAVA
jgi:hypothetical protein